MKDASHRQPDVPVRACLRAEQLESRETPSVTLRVDYTYDTAGFFSSPDRRAVIERVAAELGSKLQDSLAPIVPSAGNTWQAAFYNSLTKSVTRMNNPTIRADELVVYVAGGPLPGAELGIASSGSWSATGSQEWINTVRGRGQAGALAGSPTDEASWGGFVAFDSTVGWNFGDGAMARDQYDFASVAYHELFHILGFGLGDPVFARWVRNGSFTGPKATAAFGGPVPVEPGGEPDHWAAGTTAGGQQSVMLPSLQAGTRRVVTAVDWAALDDIGWDVSATAPPAPPAIPPTPLPLPTLPRPAAPETGVGNPLITSPVETAVEPVAFAVGGDAGASPTVAAVDSRGRYAWTLQPFPPGFTGGVRAAAADFNGDGVKDVVAGTGPGATTRVLVFDGKTRAELFSAQPFEAGFAGGVHVAAGDLTGDGRAELVVSPDEGGGPRVRVYDGNGFGQLTDFFGIEDPNFRGGARVAIGDVDGDGTGDLVVAAGFGGGPRVAGFSGPSLRHDRTPVKVFADFFALEPSLRNGVFVSAGDVDGDGRADVIVGGGPGGGPRVTVFGGRDLADDQVVTLTNFFAGDDASRGGVRVAAADVDGDGKDDVLTGAGEGAGSRLSAYRGRELSPDRPATTAFDFDFFPGFEGGIFVG